MIIDSNFGNLYEKKPIVSKREVFFFFNIVNRGGVDPPKPPPPVRMPLNKWPMTNKRLQTNSLQMKSVPLAFETQALKVVELI